MSMGKKQFIELANTVRVADFRLSFKDEKDYWHVVGLIADFCRSRNSAFKRDRWLGYIKGECGPGGGGERGTVKTAKPKTVRAVGMTEIMVEDHELA